MAQRFFQWVAGERRGEVIIYDDIVEDGGEHYLLFKDLSRVNTDLAAEINDEVLTGKLIAEVESPDNIWKFTERTIENKPRFELDHETQVEYEIPSVEEIMTDGAAKPKMKKVIDLVPPRKTHNKFGRLATSADMDEKYDENNLPGPVTQPDQAILPTITPPQKQVLVGDPVYIMMDKAKKIDTEVNMTLTISLPSSQLFDVVRDSFEDGANKALEYIIENIDITDIKTALKEGIEEMYGPNVDPEDNKVALIKEEEHIEAGYINYEPDVLEEPIIRDAKTEESMDELSTELKEKAEKITIGHE